MSVLLDLAYLGVVAVLSPWLAYKAATTGKYRRGLGQKLTGAAPVRSGGSLCAWFHGVSVGEIHLLRQVVASFRQRHPGWECVISTTTDTGHDEARRAFPDLSVFYWPLDFSWAVGRAISRVRPDLVVLAESELWPNFLRAAERAGVPVAVINARMSPRSARRLGRLGRLVRPMLGRVALFAAQTADYAENLVRLGVEPGRVKVTGSVKYDGVQGDRGNARTQVLGRLLGLREGEQVWVAGSTQAPEEEIVLAAYGRLRQQFAGLRLFLVPRQKDRFEEVAGLLRRLGIEFRRRSELGAGEEARSGVVLVDTIGELGPVWGLADVAFVGGSLDGKRGGQNMIEPAAYGAAVVFGPHVWNFREAAERLTEAGGAVRLSGAAALEGEVGRLLSDSAARERMGRAARDFVRSQQGATEATIDQLGELMGRWLGRRAA